MCLSEGNKTGRPTAATCFPAQADTSSFNPQKHILAKLAMCQINIGFVESVFDGLASISAKLIHFVKPTPQTKTLHTMIYSIEKMQPTPSLYHWNRAI